MAKYLIGIDLGTTNSALAYVDLQRKPRDGRPQVQTFAVPQLVAHGEVAGRVLLPSFLYLPGPHDLPPGATALPWDPGRNYVVGEFARNHGSPHPRAGWSPRPSRGCVMPASIVPRPCCPGPRRPMCRAFRRSRRRHAICATWSIRGTMRWLTAMTRIAWKNR